MALTNPAVTREAVQARLEGRNSDVGGMIFKGALLGCLVVVLGALVALVASVSGDGKIGFIQTAVMPSHWR